MAANGNLIFQDTNKATFVGANSNVVIDTVNASFGVGVDVNGPTSNLHVVGNAYVTSNMEVGGELTTNSNISAGYDQTITSYFGKAAIGNNGYHTGNATFAHINKMAANGYALKHNPNGRTDINSASGQDILFKNFDIEKAKITSTGNFVVNTDTLFVDAVNDRVGIGTTTPSTDLQIGNTSTKTSDTYLTIASDGGSAYAQGIRLIHHGTDTSSMHGWRIRGDDTDDCFHINYIHQGSQQTSALTINNNRNLGIGTTSPQQNLHVHEAGSGQVVIAVTNDTTGSGVNDGIHFGVDSNENGFVWHKPNTQLKFATDNTERMRVDSGVTSVVAGGTAGKGVSFAHAGIAIDRVWSNYPSITVMNQNSTGDTRQSQLRIHGCNVSYSSYPSTSGSDFGCSIYIDGTYQTNSDRRFKTNITTIDNALDIVMSLSGKRYQLLNADGSIRTNVSTNDYKYGFIAQDLEALGLNETFIHYTEEDDGTEGYNKAYSVDYDSFIPLLVNAIKEQNTIIDNMRNQLETERSRNDALEARILALENAS